MIFILFGILIFAICFSLFEALWDAEAMKEGDSNHTYKSFKIAFITAMIWLSIWVGYLSIDIARMIANAFIIIISILGVRFSLFSPFLNFIRKKPDGYKLSKYYNIYRLIVIIGIICLCIVFFKINKYA